MFTLWGPCRGGGRQETKMAAGSTNQQILALQTLFEHAVLSGHFHGCGRQQTKMASGCSKFVYLADI